MLNLEDFLSIGALEGEHRRSSPRRRAVAHPSPHRRGEPGEADGYIGGTGLWMPGAKSPGYGMPPSTRHSPNNKRLHHGDNHSSPFLGAERGRGAQVTNKTLQLSIHGLSLPPLRGDPSGHRPAVYFVFRFPKSVKCGLLGNVARTRTATLAHDGSVSISEQYPLESFSVHSYVRIEVWEVTRRRFGQADGSEGELLRGITTVPLGESSNYHQRYTLEPREGERAGTIVVHSLITGSKESRTPRLASPATSMRSPKSWHSSHHEQRNFSPPPRSPVRPGGGMRSYVRSPERSQRGWHPGSTLPAQNHHSHPTSPNTSRRKAGVGLRQAPRSPERPTNSEREALSRSRSHSPSRSPSPEMFAQRDSLDPESMRTEDTTAVSPQRRQRPVGGRPVTGVSPRSPPPRVNPVGVVPTQLLCISVFKGLHITLVSHETDALVAFAPSCFVSMELQADLPDPETGEVRTHTALLGGCDTLATSAVPESCSPVWNVSQLISLDPRRKMDYAVFRLWHKHPMELPEYQVQQHEDCISDHPALKPDPFERRFHPLSAMQPAQLLGTATVDLRGLYDHGSQRVEGWYHVLSEQDPTKSATIGQIQVGLGVVTSDSLPSRRAAQKEVPIEVERAGWEEVGALRGIAKRAAQLGSADPTKGPPPLEIPRPPPKSTQKARVRDPRAASPEPEAGPASPTYISYSFTHASTCLNNRAPEPAATDPPPKSPLGEPPLARSPGRPRRASQRDTGAESPSPDARCSSPSKHCKDPTACPTFKEGMEMHNELAHRFSELSLLQENMKLRGLIQC